MMIAGKHILNRAHAGLIFNRRVQILAENLAHEIPIGAEILDVGTGDGSIAKAISLQRPDIKIKGIDVLIRPTTHIPVRPFDGQHIPLAKNSVDVVSFVDVLHHTNDARVLLREAARVSRHYILIKDHLREGLFAKATLQTMDWIGNYGHDVVLPYNYLSEQEWHEHFRDANISPERWVERLELYPFPFSLIFGRRLHFISRLTVKSATM
jgi:SAM-dependent methyltransferase